jgi:hypothetical protein
MEYLSIIPIWFWGTSVLLFLVIITWACYAIYTEVKFLSKREKEMKGYNDHLLSQWENHKELYKKIFDEKRREGKI